MAQFHSVPWIPYVHNVAHTTGWFTKWYLMTKTCANDIEVWNLPPMNWSAWRAEHWALDSYIVVHRTRGNALKVKTSEITRGLGKLDQRKITSKTYCQKKLSVILSTYSLLELPSSLRQRRLQWERSESQGRCKQSSAQWEPLAWTISIKSMR